VSGIYEKTLIINLPGSSKASKECLCVVASAIPHAVSLIKDEKEISKQFHNQLDFTTNNESSIPVRLEDAIQIFIVSVLQMCNQWHK